MGWNGRQDFPPIIGASLILAYRLHWSRLVFFDTARDATAMLWDPGLLD